MTSAERANIVADVLDEVSNVMYRVGYPGASTAFHEHASKLRVPEQPEAPEIPIGPGDEGRTSPLGRLLVIRAISAGWRMMYRGDGIMFAEPISNDFIRTKIAEIKPGDPVEIVSGAYAGKCGIVVFKHAIPLFDVRTDDGTFQCHRHEIRRLKA